MTANLYVEAGYVEAGYTQSGVTVNWPIYEIFVPKAALTVVQTTPVEIRSLDADWFHNELRKLEETEDGRGGWSRTHDYNAEATLSGTAYALLMEILSPYTVTFENGDWNVNIIGGNTNIADRVNKNSVGVNTANSAGLQTVTVTENVLTPEQIAQLEELWRIRGLDPLNPMNANKNTGKITAGDIDITVTGDGVNEATFTRDAEPSILVDELGNFLIDELGNNIEG